MEISQPCEVSCVRDLIRKAVDSNSNSPKGCRDIPEIDRVEGVLGMKPQPPDAKNRHRKTVMCMTHCDILNLNKCSMRLH